MLRKPGSRTGVRIIRTAVLALVSICLIPILLLLPGCGTAQAPPPPTPRDVPFSLLASRPPGDYSQVSDFMVITDRDQYSIFKQVPDVDFSKSIVLGVGYTLPNPGYGFGIQSITQIGSTVTVETKLTPPDPSKVYVQILVPVYYLLLIDRASFDPGGELHFVLPDGNGGQIGEVVASV